MSCNGQTGGTFVSTYFKGPPVSHLNVEIAQYMEYTCPIHHLTEAISDYIRY